MIMRATRFDMGEQNSAGDGDGQPHMNIPDTDGAVIATGCQMVPAEGCAGDRSLVSGADAVDTHVCLVHPTKINTSAAAKAETIPQMNE
eukprot:scaffold20424_cov15-Prasinocladus_malaysianus.AAC.1